MVRRPSGAAADVDEDVEEHQRDADRLLELPPEAVGQPAVRADDQAHQSDALVVDLAEDAAGAATLDRRRDPARRTLVISPLVGMVAVPMSLLSLSRNRSAALVSLLDKNLYNQISYAARIIRSRRRPKMTSTTTTTPFPRRARTPSTRPTPTSASSPAT